LRTKGHGGVSFPTHPITQYIPLLVIRTIHPPHITPRSTLILSTYLHFGLPSGLLPYAPPKLTYIPLLRHSCYIPYPPHPRLDHDNYTCRRVQLCSLSLRSFLHPPTTSSLFGPNILISTLFSNNPSLCHVPPPLKSEIDDSHPYKTKGNFHIFRQQRRPNVLGSMAVSIGAIQSPLNFLPNQIFVCCCCSHVYCDVFDWRPSLLGNRTRSSSMDTVTTPVMLRYMVTNSGRASVSIVAGSVKEGKTIHSLSPRPSAFGVSLRQPVSGIRVSQSSSVSPRSETSAQCSSVSGI
jgi:hypothetical protein